MDLVGVGGNLIDHQLFQLSFDAKPSDLHGDAPLFQTLLTLKSSEPFRYHDLQILPMSIFASSIDSNNVSCADFGMLTSLVKPLSHGRLRLRSENPNAAPHVDLGYFTHPNDMPRMIEAICAAREIAKTPPLCRLLRHEIFPGARISGASNLESAVLSAVGTYHHPVGTCRMGSATDEEAVVDSQGNVHGVEGMSVIDASIMPTIPAANTNLPTIMLAERCLDWLK
jgi:choline dehydrogenase